MRTSPGAREDPAGPPRAARDAPPGLLRVIDDGGRADPSQDPRLPPGTLLSIHRQMFRARLVDAALIALQQQGRIASYNAAPGQEAVPVGATFAMDAKDWVFPALRENAVLLARGLSMDAFVAQLFGSAGDSQKGRQAPGYLGSRALAVASTSSAVATQLPHAVGMAWAARREGARTAVLAFVGDGGTSAGDFHAAMNFAAVFRAPCVVVVQNNQYALSTPAARQTASLTFAAKGRAYGVPSLRVDGEDVLAVYRAVSDARARATAGAGPTLVECVTRGSPPFTTVDGAPAVAPGNGHAANAAPDASDPLLRLERHLAYRGVLEPGHAARLEAEITAEIARAVERGEAVPAPRRSTLFDDVYATCPPHLVEQAKPYDRG